MTTSKSLSPYEFTFSTEIGQKAADRIKAMFDVAFFSYPEPSEQKVVNELINRFGAEQTKAIGREILRYAGESGDVEALRNRLGQYAQQFATLQKQACPYATVVATRADGKVVINYSGKNVEVERGKHEGLRPGTTVKIVGDTLQILDVVADAPAAGEVCTVSRVASPSSCEIDRAGTARAVAYHGALEEGDRVMLDASGSVVVANLGQPKNACTLSAPTGVTWDDIGGLEDAKRQLREAIEAPVRYAEAFARYGKRPIKGVLLYGAPGCGKTMLGKAAATALGQLHGDAAGAFFYVKGPELLNAYVGTTEERVRALFASARRHRARHGYPAIVFLDEADALLGKRGIGLGTLSSTVVPAFLAEMDGLEDTGALVLLATNRPDVLDPAVIRDGRIDRRIRVERPSKVAARAILARRLASAPLAVQVEDAAETAIAALYDKAHALYYVRKHSSVGRGVAMTLGHVVSGAMLTGIVDRATSSAMQREIEGGDGAVTLEDMHAAVAEAHAQSVDMNHMDEIAEFCDGWEHEVAGIDRARNASAVVVSQGVN